MIRFLFSIFFLLIQFSVFAENVQKFFWKKSADSKVWIWTSDTRDFTWTGSNIDGFANGSGILKYSESLFAFEGAKFVYGAKDNDFVELNGTGDKYVGEKIGEGEKSLPNGLGVLVKKNGNVYLGSFKKGKIEGKSTRVQNGKIIYKGDFKANVCDGIGEFFENEKLSYKGEFKNGKRNGLGTEYKGSVSASGKFKDNLKNGLFTISVDAFSLGLDSKNKIVREVFYKDDIPDLESAKIFYSKGVTWQGAIDERMNPKGEGILSYSNGDTYEGEIEWNRRNGFGKFTSGEISYEGEWVNDNCFGFGEATFREGWFYSGNWKDNAFDGHGTLCAGDFKYTGEWVQGKKNGFGTLYLGKTRFDGEFKNDRINGEGIIVYANGDSYEGEWVDSTHEGFGDYYWADGSSYSGEWMEDLQDGYGSLKFFDGDSYEGEFRDGKYWGKGVFSYKSGDSYSGEFKNNLKNGIGIYKFADGSIYEGEFKNDSIDGNGKFHFKDGSRYEGHFENGKVSGKGTLYIPCENSFLSFYSTQWNGKELPDSGKLNFPNGDEFVGKLWNGKPTADGIWRRNGQKTLKDDAFKYYKEHEETIKSAVSTTQLVLTGVSIAGNVVAVVAAVPCPPAAGIALAVSKVADIANVSISGLSIVAGTGVMLRETEDARAMGDFEEEKRIKKEYFKEQIWNVTDVALTAGSVAFKALRAEKSSVKAIQKSKAVNLKRLNAKLSSIKGKGKIKLSKSEMDWILKDPKVNIRATVRAKTGAKSFGDGFQEFFVRLADGDKAQVKSLMEVPEVKKIVNSAIRGGGGKHEWLMTKNFTDFLTNAKWGNDGQKAALALTELVQDTKTVAFKNGGTHFNKMNSGKFHQGLSKVIESSDNIDDLLGDVKKYAQNSLTKESFEEFAEIFERCFSKI